MLLKVPPGETFLIQIRKTGTNFPARPSGSHIGAPISAVANVTSQSFAVRIATVNTQPSPHGEWRGGIGLYTGRHVWPSPAP